MNRSRRWLIAAALPCAAALLSACASTDVTLTPPQQTPVCNPAAAARVLWTTRWRPDQKDVAARETAAAQGLVRFFAESGCFAQTTVHRLPQPDQPDEAFDTVVTIEVRELGPVVRLLSSAALIEGGTEVVLQISDREPRSMRPQREFTVHWRHGGPGVIKGIASLPDDMYAALRSGLQTEAIRR